MTKLISCLIRCNNKTTKHIPNGKQFCEKKIGIVGNSSIIFVPIVELRLTVQVVGHHSPDFDLCKYFIAVVQH